MTAYDTATEPVTKTADEVVHLLAEWVTTSAKVPTEIIFQLRELEPGDKANHAILKDMACAIMELCKDDKELNNLLDQLCDHPRCEGAVKVKASGLGEALQLWVMRWHSKFNRNAAWRSVEFKPAPDLFDDDMVYASPHSER